MKKIIAGIMILVFVSFYSLPAFAAGNIGPTGPQEPTGAIEPTGPQTQTGAIEPTGPQTPTGPQEIISNPIVETSGTENQTEQNLSNNFTGSNSENLNDSNSSADANINLTNNAEADNDISANLVTGQNGIGSNTVVGNVSTGDINGNVCVINALNSSLGPDDSIGGQSINTSGMNGITLAPADTRLNLQNATTGENSENSNVFNGGQVIDFFEVNDAAANNSIEIDADTGNNEISNNTKVGELQTGDIAIAANLINLLNISPEIALSIDFWNLFGGLVGDITISEANDITGSDSENKNLVNLDGGEDISISNNSETNNNINLSANTGGNAIGSNTAIGDIKTGDSTIKNTLVNVANIITAPVFYLVNVFGTWTSGALLGIDPSMIFINEINNTTGTNSENSNLVTAENNADLSIENNALINNNLNIKANTGNNKISNNTVAGGLSTGDIKLASNVINISNLVGKGAKAFALRIINIFGNWCGGGDGKGGGGDDNNGGGESDGSDENGSGQGGGGFSENPSDTGSSLGGFIGNAKPLAKLASFEQSNVLPDAGGNLTTTQNNPVVKSMTTTTSRSAKEFIYWIAAASAVLILWGSIEYLAYRKMKKI